MKVLNPQFRTQVSHIVVFFCVMAVRLYQICISPALGPRCRFYPSCSQYSLLALQKYGALSGLKMSVQRICKCHPFHRGGVDFP
jgi:uncharacterized protein